MQYSIIPILYEYTLTKNTYLRSGKGNNDMCMTERLHVNKAVCWVQEITLNNITGLWFK